jgi:transcriptional regulator with XRE-family HTH domain
MESVIHPEVLKALMARQKLTQQALADLSKVGIATIKRICSGKDSSKGQRLLTLKRLAEGLKVPLDVLTATELSPADEDQHLKSFVTIKAPVSRQTDLSYQAVEAIYGIPRSAQIAMAPLFSALIAEASLKWRTDRLKKLSSVLDNLEAVRGDNHLLGVAFVRMWEAEKIEKQSIEQKDVLGANALEKLRNLADIVSSDFDINSLDLIHCDPESWVSPFLLFLKEYSGLMASADVKIELSDENGNPQIPNGVVDYRIGEVFVDEICGDNSWARIAIEFGHATLSDIPKVLLLPEMAAERQAYLSAQMSDDKRWAHARLRVEERMSYLEAKRLSYLEAGIEVDDADRTLFGEGPYVVTDELIRNELAILDAWGR